jgi:hypothetical protein
MAQVAEELPPRAAVPVSADRGSSCSCCRQSASASRSGCSSVNRSRRRQLRKSSSCDEPILSIGCERRHLVTRSSVRRLRYRRLLYCLSARNGGARRNGMDTALLVQHRNYSTTCDRTQLPSVSTGDEDGHDRREKYFVIVCLINGISKNGLLDRDRSFPDPTNHHRSEARRLRGKTVKNARLSS